VWTPPGRCAGRRCFRVISIGRLDLTSEGLLLLTNDGELARKLEHPDTGWTRRYRVRVHGPVDEKKQSTETFPEMEAELGQQNSAAAATEAESAAALDEEIQQEES